MESEREDKQQLTDAQEIEGVLSTRGWSLIKAAFDQRILDLQNINNIDTDEPAKMQTEIRARVLAYKLLFDFLKQDVYGVVEQQRATHSPLIENTESDYIVRGKEGQ